MREIARTNKEPRLQSLPEGHGIRRIPRLEYICTKYTLRLADSCAFTPFRVNLRLRIMVVVYKNYKRTLYFLGDVEVTRDQLK